MRFNLLTSWRTETNPSLGLYTLQFEPLDGHGWGSGDYSQGCHCVDAGCDGFEDLGDVRFGFGNVSLVKGKSRSFCERECLGDCGCVGLSFKSIVGVPSGGSGRKVFDWKVLSGVVIGSVEILGVMVVTLLVMVKRRVEGKKLEEDEEDGFLGV
ncbi:hypothetical protein V8G54_036458 [Vigna mungo]|uniref:Uncharacterized protein n=1 Tax=Vigna mungo TaxID=3915 RepID=A0AAQ3MIG8_VIGMU